MQRIENTDNFKIKLHIGCDEKRLYITAVLTNTTDEKVTFTTNMGSWCNIRLIDNKYNVNRLESTLSTAAIKNWELDPEESIVHRRETTRDSEINTELENMTNTNYTKEAENYKNKDPDIHFIPNLDLSNSKDLNCDLTVILSLEFGDHSDIEIDFKPAQISDNKLVIE